jgi:hypothetical protein
MTSTHGRRRRLAGGVLAALLGLTVLSGCSDDETSPPDASSGTGTTAGGPSASATVGAAAGPGEQATAYPVPATPSPSALPALGTRENGEWTLVLNAVRRVSDEALLVEATLTAKKNAGLLVGLEESGYVYVKGSLNPALEFSAVTVLAPGAPTEYLVMRDSEGRCACTQGVNTIKQGEALAVYAMVSSPPDAQTVTVVVRGFAPFKDIAVVS